MLFQESSMNSRREMADKVLCSSSRVPFIIDGSPPNLQAFCTNTLQTVLSFNHPLIQNTFRIHYLKNKLPCLHIFFR
jgi:hypothetical protein